MAIAKVSIEALLRFRDCIDELLQNIQSVREKASYLQDVIVKIDCEINKYEQAQKQCQEIEAQVVEKLKKLTKKKEKLEEEIKQLEEKIEALNKKIDPLEREVEALERRKEPLEKDVERLSDKAERLESRINKLEGIADRISSEISHLEAKASKSSNTTNNEHESNSYSDRIADKISELNCIESEISEKTSELNEVNSELSEKENELNEINAELSQKNSELEELRSQKQELERILAEKRNELEKVLSNIQKAQELQNTLAEKQNEIGVALDKLQSLKEALITICDELDEILTKLEQCCRQAVDCIAQSSFYISRYLDVTICDIAYTAPKAATMRKCLNLDYAGKQYDYRDISDDESDPRSYIKKKYPDVSFSNIDEFGNTYPDFSKYSKFSYKFPPVTKENLAAGTCLIGDSTAGSADFKKFRKAMEAQGYSKREIAELLSTHTIHHHQDGQTMQLIPRDLHESCKHNGGAEKIRLMRAMIGG